MGVHIALQPVTTLTSTLAAPTFTLGAMNQTLPDARIGFNKRDHNLPSRALSQTMGVLSNLSEAGSAPL